MEKLKLGINNIKKMNIYLILILLVFLGLFMLYGGISIDEPIIYEGDSFSVYYLIKTVEENGWYLENSRAGGGKGFYYLHSTGDMITYIIIRLLCIFTDDIFLIHNIYYFFTFVITSITCYYAFTKLNINSVLAMVGAFLYTFLPYHQMRLGHLIWLAGYYMIPLVCVYAIWIANNKIEFNNITLKFSLKEGVLIGLLAGLSNIYYVYFTLVIYFIAFIIGIYKKFGRVWFKNFLVLMGSVIIGLIINYAKVFWFLLFTNERIYESSLAKRIPQAAETFGVKLIQFFVPRSEHRIELFSRANQTYRNLTASVNENEIAALGFIGGIGLVILLFNLFTNINKKSEFKSSVVLINIGLVLTAIIGGIGAIIAYIFPLIRCYNRLSIFIGFFSILYLAILGTEVLSNMTSMKKIGIYFISIVLMGFGFFDQTVPFLADNQTEFVRVRDIQKNFIKEIENAMPAQSKIYQYPHKCYPNGSKQEYFQGVLYSDSLVWSFGCLEGGYNDIWEHSINKLPVEKMLEQIVLEGYRGLLIDVDVCREMGIDIDYLLSFFQNKLHISSIDNQYKNLIFYDLSSYAVKIENVDDIQKALVYEYGTEFWIPEYDEDGEEYRWAENKSEIFVINPGDDIRKFSYSALVGSADLNESKLCIILNDKEVTYDIKGGAKETDIIFEGELEPGENRLIFESNIENIDSPVGVRKIAFYLKGDKIY